MGCHTWAYCKIEPETEKEIRIYLKNQLNNIPEIDTCDSKHLSEILEEIGDINYIGYNGCIYEQCAFDEPIRIYGYPDVVFTDVDKFIDWIKKSEAEKGYPISEYYNEEYNKYVKGFDETAEKLVRKFWKKYDNQVYVEFG